MKAVVASLPNSVVVRMENLWPRVLASLVVRIHVPKVNSDVVQMVKPRLVARTKKVVRVNTHVMDAARMEKQLHWERITKVASIVAMPSMISEKDTRDVKRKLVGMGAVQME